MSYVRIQKSRENPYTMVINKMIDDERLSWKSKGIMTYLLRLPDNWKIYEEEISTHASDGIKSLKTGIKELIELGYIERTQLRDDKGRFIGYNYCINEFPSESLKTDNGKMDNDNSEIGKGHANNTNLNNTDLNNTNYEEVEEAYSKAIDQKLTPAEKEILKEYIENYPVGLILKAIRIAVEQRVVKIKYIHSTLEDWKLKGLTTIQAVENYLVSDNAAMKKGRENKRKNIKNAKVAYNIQDSSSSNSFTNRKQANYNIAEIERQLLGWDNTD